MSLKEITADQVNSHLSEDAKRLLHSRIYVPYIQGVADILYELSDEESFIETITAFIEMFPELVGVDTTPMETPWKLITKDPNRPYSKVLAIRIGEHVIPNDIPFHFEMNNRLADFFVSRNLPVFAGIKTIRKI